MLDALVGESASADTRQKFRKMLREGQLDEREVELQVADNGGASMPTQVAASSKPLLRLLLKAHRVTPTKAIITTAVPMPRTVPISMSALPFVLDAGAQHL